uniref:Protein FAM136A n=1 Tax=Salmo salar TaxID=8030 RepID=B5XAW7_SALSA|nr:FAM136A [Salmo salar]
MRATFEMTEAHQARVLKTIEDMVQSLERNHIRKLQPGSHVEVQCRVLRALHRHNCIEHCNTPLAQAQGLVTNELEKFQDRLTRCTMHCNDKARDLLDSGAKENCVGSCVDDHVNLIPSMTQTQREPELYSTVRRGERTADARDILDSMLQ